MHQLTSKSKIATTIQISASRTEQDKSPIKKLRLQPSGINIGQQASSLESPDEKRAEFLSGSGNAVPGGCSCAQLERTKMVMAPEDQTLYCGGLEPVRAGELLGGGARWNGIHGFDLFEKGLVVC